MNLATDLDRLVLQQVIRGERDVSDLDQIGISMELKDGQCSWKNPRHLSVSADVGDLAKGFLAHRNDPQRLREWAMFIEAADLDLKVEDDPAGDMVLEAIWDAAFHNPIDPETVKKLEDLVQRT